MARHIDWEKGRKRDLVQKWQTIPLDDIIREPTGSPELRHEREIEVAIGETRPVEKREGETCYMRLQFEPAMPKKTVIYHFVRISHSEAAAVFPSRAWTPDEVDAVLDEHGYVCDVFSKKHALEVRTDINVYPKDEKQKCQPARPDNAG